VELLLGMAFTSLLLLYVLILGLTEGRRRYPDCAGREEAEKKARALFKKWLSPAQLAQYESDAVWCFAPKGYLPVRRAGSRPCRSRPRGRLTQAYEPPRYS
jgi:hypothetical protein